MIRLAAAALALSVAIPAFADESAVKSIYDVQQMNQQIVSAPVLMSAPAATPAITLVRADVAPVVRSSPTTAANLRRATYYSFFF